MNSILLSYDLTVSFLRFKTCFLVLMQLVTVTCCCRDIMLTNHQVRSLESGQVFARRHFNSLECF
ncbi:hypothetical protein EYF80_062024 [Liparis tanakae]|uniref:Uncharacterized protein n=1 Tax=Liparis tanakae TaxID=230148 RepID=A0A4Z2EG06_9TELE|nr:hypothetical protein EYF80_062024 [Liparis tanakae]